MTVQEWRSIQDKRVGAGSLVHSDGAAAYRKCNTGVAHDWVNHGSGTRKKAVYTKTFVHKRPSGKTVAKGGTQSFALGRPLSDQSGWQAQAPRSCREVEFVARENASMVCRCWGRLCAGPLGGQGLDGLWGHLKKNAVGVNARHAAAVDRHLHEAQWWHWCGFKDKWAAAGEVLAFAP